MCAHFSRKLTSSSYSKGKYGSRPGFAPRSTFPETWSWSVDVGIPYFSAARCILSLPCSAAAIAFCMLSLSHSLCGPDLSSKLSYPLCRTGLGWLLTTTASAKGNCNTSTQRKHNTCCILLSIENNYLLPILALTFCCSQLETSMAQWGKVAMSQIWSMLTDRTQVRNVRTLLSVFVQILISQTPHFITWLLT